MYRKCIFISMQKGQSNWNQIFSYIIQKCYFSANFISYCVYNRMHYALSRTLLFFWTKILFFIFLFTANNWILMYRDFFPSNSCEWHKRDCLGTHVGRRWQSLFIFNKLQWLYQDIYGRLCVSWKYNLAMGVFYLYLNNNENSFKQYLIVNKIYHIVTGGQRNAKSRFFIIIENC